MSALALFFLPAEAVYDKYLNADVNNGMIVCHTKEGIEYQIDTTLFPENIVIDGKSLSFYRALKSDKGDRYYEYLDDLGGKVADLVIGNEKIFLLISRKKASCDDLFEVR
ncbi:hypothetical protein NFL35_23415 (plasmid) [Enterobacter hormaechei]|uniref:hypothetical protein n=1 Tax=Enterobacter hormaechei TaxID=158836 RepID=UPI00242C0073|nr:hypothetical protein [Enterobacter hormaechei]EKK5923336.1 hypothetical protein [Enterobacter hormaechei]WGB36723.1 hypothetical protein NFL35_23415 [Enterobacter hormaechei]